MDKIMKNFLFISLVKCTLQSLEGQKRETIRKERNTRRKSSKEARYHQTSNSRFQPSLRIALSTRLLLPTHLWISNYSSIIFEVHVDAVFFAPWLPLPHNDGGHDLLPEIGLPLLSDFFFQSPFGFPPLQDRKVLTLEDVSQTWALGDQGKMRPDLSLLPSPSSPTQKLQRFPARRL